MSAATFAALPSGESHDVQTSNNSADVKTFAKPKSARAFYAQCFTSNCWINWAGATPTDTEGMEIVAGQNPVLIVVDVHKDGLLAASEQAAAASQIKIGWLG